jgi:hypothetical protein
MHTHTHLHAHTNPRTHTYEHTHPHSRTRTHSPQSAHCATLWRVLPRRDRLALCLFLCLSQPAQRAKRAEPRSDCDCPSLSLSMSMGGCLVCRPLRYCVENGYADEAALPLIPRRKCGEPISVVFIVLVLGNATDRPARPLPTQHSTGGRVRSVHRPSRSQVHFPHAQQI